jgi:alpha/beta superfamily hydrolase
MGPIDSLMKQKAFELDHNALTIRGMTYQPDGSGRFPTVVFLHGFTGQRIESGFMFVQLARSIVQRGFSVVTFDFTNSGESDGSFENMLATGELADALHITQWTQSQLFVDRSRMALLGFSLGGLLACCVNARVDAYKALILIAPTTVANMHRFSRKRTIEGSTVLGPLKMHSNFFDDLATLEPAADLICKPRPTLIIQGTGDKTVSPDISQEYIDAMKCVDGPLTVKTIEDADHVFNDPIWRDQLASIVGDWATEKLA